MKIDVVEVYGIEDSIIASKLPMLAEYSEDEHNKQGGHLLYELTMNEQEEDRRLESNSNYKRAIKLGNTPAGSGHNNYLKGIIVQGNLSCSQNMHRQILRYNFFDIVSSQSLMHRLLEMDVSKQCNEYVQSETVDILEGLIILYNEDPSKENYLKVIYNCPMGLELTFRFTTNYLQLKTIYNQRHNHQLPEWQLATDWMLTLPYFKELTGCGEVR